MMEIFRSTIENLTTRPADQRADLHWYTGTEQWSVVSGQWKVKSE